MARCAGGAGRLPAGDAPLQCCQPPASASRPSGAAVTAPAPFRSSRRRWERAECGDAGARGEQARALARGGGGQCRAIPLRPSGIASSRITHSRIITAEKAAITSLKRSRESLKEILFKSGKSPYHNDERRYGCC